MEFLVTYDKSIKSCEFCDKPFSFFRIRHACKRCGKIICDSCGKARFKIITYDSQDPHKVCPCCDKEHHYQVDFAASMKTSWNTSSVVAKKWLKKCGLEIDLQRRLEEDYQSYLKMTLNAPVPNSFSMIDKDIMQAKCDRSVFNYSMQDFLYYNQEKLKRKCIRESISRVLKAFCVKYPLNGYSHALSYLTVFLLSLMDEESAFYMLGHLVMYVLPKNIYDQPQNGTSIMGFQHEKYILSNLFRDQLMLNAEDAKAVNAFLDLDGCALIVPVLINYLNFECVFETWSQIVTNQNVNPARKVIVKVIEVLLPKIRTGSFTDLISFKQLITRIITIDHVHAAQKIVINEEYLRYLDNKFKSEYVFEWLKKEIHLHQTLQKINSFTWEEIKLIKDVYKRSLRQQRRLSFGNTRHYAGRTSLTPRSSNILGRGSVGSQNSPDDSLRLSFQSDHRISFDLEEFGNVMYDAFSEDPQNDKFSQIIDFENIYEAFDLDRSGKIGLKEFLFGLFMLSQGKLEDKINAIFHLFDEEEKGYLSHDEYNRFIRSLLQFSLVINKDEMNPFFNTELETFCVKMKRITENKETVKFSDVSNGIFAETFVRSCEMGEKVQKFEDLMSKLSESLQEKPASKGENLQMALSDYFSSASTTETLEARLQGTPPPNDTSIEHLCSLFGRCTSNSLDEGKQDEVKEGGTESMGHVNKKLVLEKGRALSLEEGTGWEILSTPENVSPKENEMDQVFENGHVAVEQEKKESDEPEECGFLDKVSMPVEIGVPVVVGQVVQKPLFKPKSEENEEQKTQAPSKKDVKYSVRVHKNDLKIENPIISDMKPLIDGLIIKRKNEKRESVSEMRVEACESCRSCRAFCNIF